MERRFRYNILREHKRKETMEMLIQTSFLTGVVLTGVGILAIALSFILNLLTQ